MLREMLTFDDVLIEPSYSDVASRKEVTLETSLGDFATLRVPVISANMDTITGAEMVCAMRACGGYGILHRFMSIEENMKQLRLGYGFNGGVSIGLGEEGQRRAAALFTAGARVFCIDVAHGHTKSMGMQIKSLRSHFGSEVFVIAGNVATYAGADYLSACGADAIKVGIGPGSVCTTRIKTGCGVPQLSAIIECSRVNKTIIADGGIRYPSDVAKAIAAGADMVMIGGLLAGTDETPGEIKNTFHGPQKVFRGMASKEAQDDALGGMDDWKTAEGVQTNVPYKGAVENVINDIAGGLRSAFSYVGARNIHEFQAKARFVRVTPSSLRENSAHIEESEA